LQQSSASLVAIQGNSGKQLTLTQQQATLSQQVADAVTRLEGTTQDARDGNHQDLASIQQAIAVLQFALLALPGGVAAAVKGAVPTAGQITQAVRAANPGPAPATPHP
jgi:hypothetical protein